MFQDRFSSGFPRLNKDLAKRRQRKYFKQGKTVSFEDIAKILVAEDSYKFRFNVPVEKCVLDLGWRYSIDENPWVKSYELDNFLDEFYTQFCPQDLIEALTFESPKRDYPSLELPGLPWSIKIDKTSKPMKKDPFAPESYGPGVGYGYSSCGPVTHQRLSNEKSRLINVYKSIKKNGYKPEYYGYPCVDICGYFMVKQSKFLFIVRAGRHRASALAALGWESLPVTLVPHPHLITEQHLELLAGTAYDEKELPAVKTIFNAYFDETLREKRKQALASWMSLAEAKAKTTKPLNVVEF